MKIPEVKGGKEWTEFTTKTPIETLRELFTPKEPTGEFRTIITRDGVAEGYTINREGYILSYKRYDEGQPIKWSNRTASKAYPNVGLQVASLKHIRPTILYQVHKLVALTFPDEVHFPDWLLEAGWNEWNDSLRWKFLTDVLVVDHIDGHTWCPNVKNLAWTSHGENSVKGIKSYNQTEGRQIA